MDLRLALGADDVLRLGYYRSTPPLPGSRWQYRANGPIVASAAVAHDLVYGASERGTLVALELHTGTPRWEFGVCGAQGYLRLIGSRWGTPLRASHDQTLTALDARHGTLHWQFTASAPIHATPAVGDGRVYVATMDGVVYALE